MMPTPDRIHCPARQRRLIGLLLPLLLWLQFTGAAHAADLAAHDGNDQCHVCQQFERLSGPLSSAGTVLATQRIATVPAPQRVGPATPCAVRPARSRAPPTRL